MMSFLTYAFAEKFIGKWMIPSSERATNDAFLFEDTLGIIRSAQKARVRFLVAIFLGSSH